MKLPLKYIAILVILSLAGIFSYQAYWLGGLYRTMRNDLERNIIEAMRMSDYNEMMLRVERMRKDSADHGTVSVSAGFEKDGTQNKTYVHSTTSIDRNGRKEETSDQQVIHQKSFVAGGSHLRHKNDIVCIDRRLIFVAEIRVHRMAHLMNQRELTV